MMPWLNYLKCIRWLIGTGGDGSAGGGSVATGFAPAMGALPVVW
jgi:hypothetical protein